MDIGSKGARGQLALGGTTTATAGGAAEGAVTDDALAVGRGITVASLHEVPLSSARQAHLRSHIPPG